MARFSFFLLLHGQVDERDNEKKWEENRKQEGEAEVTAKKLGQTSYDGGARKASKVTRKRKHGEHGNAATGEHSRRVAESPGPQNTHRKTAKSTADEGDDGVRCQCRDKVGENTKHTACDHEFAEADTRAELGIEHAGGAHEECEQKGPQDVTYGFADAQSRLGKAGCPLAHGHFRSARTQHDGDQHPKKRTSDKGVLFAALFSGGK